MARQSKGAVFERDISQRLSLWVSEATNSDWFWRASMSGGRATVCAKRRGVRSKLGSGDIVAIDPGGQPLLDTFTIECKFIAYLEWDRTFNTGKSLLIDYWDQAIGQCVGTEPLLLIRPNRRQELAFTTLKGWKWIKEASDGSFMRQMILPPIGMHGFHLDELFKIPFPRLMKSVRNWQKQNRGETILDLNDQK